MKKLIAFLLLLILGFGGLWFASEAYLDKTINVEGQALVEVKKGASLTSVANQLSKAGLIVYPRLFVKLGQYKELGASIKYGEYLLSSKDSYRDVLNKLSTGENYTYKVTFVEGDHMFKYAQTLDENELCAKDEFLSLVRNSQFIRAVLGEEQASLEGYLFPETYAFSKVDGCKKIISTMVGRFKEFTGNLLMQSKNLNRHELVTLASIVEKETGASFERPIISSVFHNRLKKRMRLQTDPTIIYGILHETGREVKNIRKKDLRRPTAYNTYVIKGLPPGPIGNPGIEALRAAVKPKETDFLYFVSQNDGTHVFTKNYKGHLRAVKKFQMDPKMRRGKSWRDLKNKGKQK